MIVVTSCPSGASVAATAESPDTALLALRPEIEATKLRMDVTCDAIDDAETSGSANREEAARQMFKEACDRMNELGHRIAGMQASTIEGLLVKAEFSRANDEDEEFAEVAVSIARDLLEGGFRR